MPLAQTSDSTSGTPRPLRLWPGVVAAVLLVAIRLGAPLVSPDYTIVGVLGGFAGAAVILLWWLFFSRAPWVDRLGAIALMVAALFATWPLMHESIATGAMGGLLPLLSVPVVSVAFVAWAVATQHLSNGVRRATLVPVILLAFGFFALLRTGGFTSDFKNDLSWRWSQTPEERLLAQAADEPLAAPPAAAPSPEAAPLTPANGAPTSPSKIDPAGETPTEASATAPGAPSRAEWPGFRGAGRDSIIRGVRIDTDWAKSPPTVIWRRPVGPGWSSFAVHGDLIYTQEQRGDDELVAAYSLSTGKPVWMHKDPARFWESNGGAGPRGTPTLLAGRVFAFGATGVLNALDAVTGTVIWSRNAATDTNTETPMWGFASSPTIVNNIVIVAVSGTMAGYDLATGTTRWIGPHRGNTTYSSPQLVTIDGVDQVLLLSEGGAVSLAPADGATLWEHAWPGTVGAIVQPSRTADGDVLISTLSGAGGTGIRRLSVAHKSSGAATRAESSAPIMKDAWTATERWTTTGLKPYFNDFVVHKGHAYGFDGAILSCIDLETGTRKWKGGRYGSGQAVLLADQDLLLVTAEEGDLALVSATPDQFKEIARIPALDAKTWNHPVIVGDVLLVRNGEEMAAFRLSLAR